MEFNRIKEISPSSPLWLVGCGKMGSALLKAWLNNGLNPSAVKIIDPCAHETAPAEVVADQCYDSVTAIEGGASPSVVVLAVKPQIMDSVLASLADKSLSLSLVISVAAGTTINSISNKLGSDIAIVRSMPNIPASVGAGMSAMVKNANVTQSQHELAEQLFNSSGLSVWLSDEDSLNAVTAVSGSGPAYVFNMVEAMASAGVELGLDEDVAEKLARQTIIGAAALLANSDEPASKLREDVTSPKGTTEAALQVLMSEEGLARLMLKAMQKARDRGVELS